MTIKEIRNEYKEMRRKRQLMCSDLIDYIDDIWNTMNDLYTYGYVTEYSREFLAIANGYVVNTQDYDNFHIAQTLGLHHITATKRATRDFMMYWLNK